MDNMSNKMHEAKMALAEAVVSGQVTMQSIANDWGYITNINQELRSNGIGVFAKLLPHIPQSAPPAPEKLVEDAQYANTPHPGLLTLRDYMMGDLARDEQTPGEQMRGTMPQQMRHIIRQGTQQWFKEEIKILWDMMKVFREKKFLYIPNHLEYSLPTRIGADCAIFDYVSFDKVPIDHRFHEYCETNDPDALKTILKQLLAASLSGFVMMWLLDRQKTEGFQNAAKFFAGVNMRPEEAIMRGFVSATDFFLETLHYTITEHMSDGGEIDDAMFQKIVSVNQRLQVTVAKTMGLQAFAMMEGVVSKQLSEEILNTLKNIVTQNKWDFLERAAKKDRGSAISTTNPQCCRLQYTEVDGASIPAFDINLSSITSERLEELRYRQSQRGCPALQMIPEFLDIVASIYQRTVFPNVQRKSRRI
jgi:hypothetical protein